MLASDYVTVKFVLVALDGCAAQCPHAHRIVLTLVGASTNEPRVVAIRQFWGGCSVYGYCDADGGPFAGRACYLELAAERTQPLPHADESHRRGGTQFLFGDAASVVGDDDGGCRPCFSTVTSIVVVSE